jgi:hypothetical protein
VDLLRQVLRLNCCMFFPLLNSCCIFCPCNYFSFMAVIVFGAYCKV